MGRILVAVSIVCCLGASDGFACGDKFLVIGRGLRSQRAKGAVQKASILMYLDPQGGLPAAMREEGLETNLKLAGHRLHSVSDRRELAQELRAQSYDIVLAGIEDMGRIEAELGAAPARPTLLPIIYNPTGEELAAAERRYQCVMKSPSKKQHFLAVIDDAMQSRQKAARIRQGQ